VNPSPLKRGAEGAPFYFEKVLKPPETLGVINGVSEFSAGLRPQLMRLMVVLRARTSKRCRLG